MELLLKRRSFTNSTTISDLYINNSSTPFCQILEDEDKQLSSSMPLQEIQKIKVKGRTAIPYGRYEIVISYSPRFEKLLPLLLNVPGFSGIRIHPGNTHADTDGCLLPGIYQTNEKVSSSRLTFARLFSTIKEAMRTEKVYITITK